MIITIEGVDQSGKTVQSNRLLNRLSKAGVQAKLFSFPDYSTPSGREIQQGLAAETVNTRQMHELLAKNRREKLPDIQQALNDGIVIMNRYCESNIVYGEANGLAVQWLKSLDSEMPESNIVLLLDISVSESFSRKSKRDVFESDMQFMERVVSKYKIHAEQNQWHIVDGAQAPEAVHNDIWTIIKPICITSKLTNKG